MEYKAIITNKGKQLIAAAALSGAKVKPTKMYIGDGNGYDVTLNENQTSLRRLKYTSSLTSYSVTGNTVVFTAEIPVDDFSETITIREYGIGDDNNNLIAVASCYPTPVNPTGDIATTIKLTIRLVIDSVSAVSFEGIQTDDTNIIYVAKASSPHKDSARFICNGINDGEVINQAIEAASKGDTIWLLPGNYNIATSVDINKEIEFKGSGWNTVLNQADNSGETYEVLKINASRVRIKDMMLCDVDVSSPTSIVGIYKDSYCINNVFFILNNSGSDLSLCSCCVEIKADAQYGRIQDCRVFRNKIDTKVMFDLSGGTVTRTIISGNILSTSGNLNIKFANTAQGEDCVLYGNTNVNLMYD